MVAVSFHNFSKRNKDAKQNMLNMLLYLLKELCSVLKRYNPGSNFPVLLAGDFNMDVLEYQRQIARDTQKTGHPLLLYSCSSYDLTAHRKQMGNQQIDQILFWEDNTNVTHVELKLEDVKAHVIDNDTDKCHSVSTHDPLTATLKMEAEIIRRMPPQSHSRDKQPQMTSYYRTAN